MPGGFIPPEQIKTGSSRDRRSRGEGRQEGARSRGSRCPRHGRYVLIQYQKFGPPERLFRGPFYVWNQSGWSGPPLVTAAQVLPPSPVTKTQDRVSA